MSKVEYPKVFTQSLNAVGENLNLFLPNLYMIFFSLLLILMFTISSGLFPLIWSNPEILTDQQLLGENVKELIAESPSWFTFVFIIYFIAVFLIDIFFITTKYGMIKDVLTKNETDLSSGMKFARKNFKKSLGMHILTYFLILSPLFFLAGLAYAIGLTSGFFEKTGYMIIFIIFLIIVFIYWIDIFFRLLFLYPVMTFEGAATLESFKSDFRYVRSHLGHTFISWMIFITVWIIYLVIRTPIGRAGNNSQSLGVIFILTLLALFTEMIISVFEHVFIFKSYLAGKGKIIKRKPKQTEDWKDIYY